MCIRFIQKARAMNVMALSLLAKVLAVNHILTATLWYFLFAWRPLKKTLNPWFSQRRKEARA